MVKRFREFLKIINSYLRSMGFSMKYLGSSDMNNLKFQSDDNNEILTADKELDMIHSEIFNGIFGQ